MLLVSWLLIYTFLITVTESTIGANNNSNNNDEYYEVPSISLSNLKNKQDKETLIHALSSVGILAITNIDEEDEEGLFSKTREDALYGLCECITRTTTNRKKHIVDNIDNLESFTLSDGVTTRTSIATLTSIHGLPLPLNSNQIDSMCSSTTTTQQKLSESMEKLRDYVHVVSKEFIFALDDMIITSANNSEEEEGGNVLLETSSGKIYSNVNDIIEDATHLEHFHVYSKKQLLTNYDDDDDDVNNSSNSDTVVLDTHTDAGLFLSFVPSMPCNPKAEHDDESSSFMVVVDGKLQKAKFPASENTIVVMLGIGAEHWLQHNLPNSPDSPNDDKRLKATKHAVQMNYGTMRSWYGIMHLVPEKAIIERSSSSTFADMRSSMIIRHPTRITHNHTSNDTNTNVIDIGCGGHSSYNNNNKATSQQSRRRLQTHVDASVCNNETNFYCWMSCIDVPDADNALEHHLSNGQSLYCADATSLDQGLQAAVNSCTDVRTGAAGGAMNTNCIGIWHSTNYGVPSQSIKIDYDYPSDADDNYNMVQYNEYCYGGTSMYMNGFQWEGIYCVIYLFPAWVLNTPWKLCIACFGTILAGIILEAVITARRMILSSNIFAKEDKYKKLCISMLIYGIQLTLGYLIMLVVMTYSVPLFMSVIIGLMIGHVLLQVLVTPPSTSKKNKNNHTSSIVIEGATPCCQYRVDSEEDEEDNEEEDQPTKGGTQDITSDNDSAITDAHYNCCHCPPSKEEEAVDVNVDETKEKNYVSDASKYGQPESCCAGKEDNADDDKIEIVVASIHTDDVEKGSSSPTPIISSCCGGK